MKNKKKAFLLVGIALVFLFAVVVSIILLINKKKAEEGEYVWYAAAEMPEHPYPYTSFSAEVTDVYKEILLVRGLDINGSPSFSGGEFMVGVHDAIIIRQEQGEIRPEELQVGDIVFIQFSGVIKTSSPASINAEMIYYLGNKENFATIGDKK